MDEPIGIFCRILQRFTQMEQEEMIWICCYVLGQRPNPTGVEPGPNVTIGEMFQRRTIEDLRDRLGHLADHLEIQQDFLIPALLDYLVRFYEHRADPGSTGRAIDLNLRALEDL